MKNHISKFEYLKILALLTCFSPVILVVSLLIENILNSDIAVQVLNGMWIGLLFAYLSKLFTFSEYTTMHEGWSNNRKNVMLVIHMSYGILIVLILYLTGFLLQLLHFENYNPHQWIDYLQLGGFFAIVYGGVLGYGMVFGIVVDYLPSLSTLATLLSLPALLVFVGISFFASCESGFPFIIVCVVSRLIHGVLIYGYFKIEIDNAVKK